jgi:hypothetical protein
MSFSSFIQINKLSIVGLNMRLLQLQNQYLYEGLDRESRNTVMLWESAGIKLREAQLTADQIQQLFAEIEKGATAGGSNRTMLGKGKDAASAVNKAWEDLKSKVQDSKPIKNIDAAFDQAVAKIEAGLGGPDNKVNQVIQKYRKFAKDRPISQSLIYAALIAAAGISGAGLGGAAVLGLLKMTDKLLQGEKFSSAAYAGGKTGALAYGAGQIGQAMKGGDAASKDGEVFGLTAKADNSALAKDMADNPMLAQRAGVSNVSAATDAASSAATSTTDAASSLSGIKDQNAKAAWAMVQRKIEAGEITDHKAISSELNKALNKTFSDYGVNPNSPDAETSKKLAKDVLMKSKDTESLLGALQSGEVSPGGAAPDTLKGADALKAADVASSADPFTVNGQTMKASLKDTIMKMSDEDGEKAYNAWKVLVGGDADTQAKMGAGQLLQQLEKKYAKSESIDRSGKQLSEGQVYLVFNRVCTTNDRLLAEGVLKEGPMDFFKGAAAKGMQKLQGVGKNLTTKVTADKLNSAWRKAGAPTDSEELKSFLQSQGVDQTVVNTVYSSLKIKSDKPKTAGAAQSTNAQTLYAQLKKDVMALNKKEKQRIFAYLQKQLGTV